MEQMRVEELISGKQLGDNKVGLFAKVTMIPGGVLDFHEHHGETETYYIMSGEGEYDDNGVKKIVKADDTVFCEDGNGHGIRNVGSGDLVFIALIIKK
jgi:mannose-6-phosphate isomerase-like protein (cupin superfamily)